MTETGDRLRLLFDWASAQRSGQRLALWLVVALAFHAGAYLLFRVTYPPAEPARISDTALYILLPGSPEEKRLAPFLEAADPALFAPEETRDRDAPAPSMPAYEPSYMAAKPQLVPLPDIQTHVLPPLMRDFGPVPVSDAAGAKTTTSHPATETQIVFSRSLAGRSPANWPKDAFTARPGDRLAPYRFVIAIAPDGRVMHVFKDPASSGDDNKALDDAASQYLMNLWFRRGADENVTWGTATFNWGLDVKREELR